MMSLGWNVPYVHSYFGLPYPQNSNLGYQPQEFLLVVLKINSPMQMFPHVNSYKSLARVEEITLYE